MPRFPHRAFSSPLRSFYPLLFLAAPLMRRSPAACLLALVLAVPAVPAAAGVGVWTPLGPDGAEITSLAVAPSDLDVIYAGTLGSGIFSSTDGGETWSIGRGVQRAEVRDLAVDPSHPDTAYAVLTNSAILKSTDGGATWTQPAGQPFGVTNLFSVEVDPRRPRTVYAGTGGGVWWSTDGGVTWKPRSQGMPAHTQVTALATEPRTGMLYAGTVDRGVFRSSDQGARWRASVGFPGGQVYSLAADPSGSGVVLAGIFNGIYRSADGGRTWSLTAGGPATSYSLAFQRRGRAYAGSLEQGVFRSTDGGTTWQRTPNDLSAAIIRALAVSPQAVYAGLMEGKPASGVYRSFDQGSTWEPAQHGIYGLRISALEVDPADSRTIYAAAGRSGLFKTGDGGLSWTRLDTGVPEAEANLFGPLLVDPAHPATVYAGCGGSCGPLLRSDDGGATWQRLGGELPEGPGLLSALVPDPRASGALWAAGPSGLFHSSDRGVTWQREDLGTNDYAGVADAAVSPRAPDLVWAAGYAVRGGRIPTYLTRLFRSADGGATWERRGVGLPDGLPLALALDPTDPATLWVSLFPGGVFRSTDSGLSWTLLSQPPGAQAVDLDATPPAGSSPAALYLSRQSYSGPPWAVLRSTDRGQTWTPLRAGLGIRIPQVLEVDPNDPGHLLLGTANGSVWTWTMP